MTDAQVVVTVPASLAQGPLTATLDATSADGKVTASQAVTLFVRGKPGTMDTTFGQNGVVEVADPGVYVDASALATDSQGRVVVGMQSDGVAKIARFSSNGLSDGSFGANGRVQVSLVALAIATSDSGRVVIATSNAAGASVLQRFATNGTRDLSFGANGDVTPAYTAVAAHTPRRIVLRSDESIVLAEEAGADWIVARFDVKGALDATFAGSGYVRQSWVPAGASSPSSGIAILTLGASGSVFLAGGGHAGAVGASQDELGLTKLTPTGALDPSVLGGGTKRVAFSNDADRSVDTVGARALPDGRFAIAARCTSKICARRLKSDGSLDPTFATGGVFVEADPFPDDVVRIIQFTDDSGLLLLGGFTTAGAPAIKRLDGSGAVDSTFAGGSMSLPIRGSRVVPSFATTRNQRLIVVAGYNPAGTGDTGTQVVLYRVWL